MQFSLDTKTPLFNFMLRGQQYALTHQQSVNAILPATGPDYRRVISKGEHFLNRDRWTARVLVGEMCKWAKTNPMCAPTRDDVQTWVNTANATLVQDPHIVIARTPDHLPLPTALALTGGAYHEAFHTVYSRRRPLLLEEVCDIVIPRWPLVADWSKYQQLLLTWSNVIEDIRIERLGCVQFPGIRAKMGELQNFILAMEAKADSTNPEPANALSIVLRTFRDVGLGYATPQQQAAMDRYQAEKADVVSLTLEGPIAPFLREAIALSNIDDLGCIRLSLEVIAILVQLGKAEEGKDGDQGKDGQDQDQQCPQCGAPGHKLIIRPKAGSAQTIGILTCTQCGHQEEVNLKLSKIGPQGKQPGKDQGPQFEGFTAEGFKEESEGSSDDDDEAGEESEGTSDDDEAEGSERDSESRKPDDSGGVEEGGRGSGGGSSEPIDYGSTELFDKLAQEVLDEAEKGEKTRMHDVSSALEEAVGTANDQEEGKTQSGEMPWHPCDPHLDEVRMIEPSRSRTGAVGKDNDKVRVEDMLKSVMPQIRYFRSRLRSIVQAAAMTDTIHGLRKGPRLSERFLVDSKIALMSGKMPSRAYQETDAQIDTSTAVAVVLDESSSMSGIRMDTAKAMLALVEPLDRLNCATLVVGVRDGVGSKYGHYGERDTNGSKPSHRAGGVIIDVFKGWEERFQAIKWRFANTLAVSSTPLSDGMQYGLEALNYRKEGHRVMFVFTDGEPNYGHLPVMQWQFRKAKAAGVHIIGVGIGSGAAYVKTTFPDHVYADNLSEFPKLLIAKLNRLFDNRCDKRGLKMNLKR